MFSHSDFGRSGYKEKSTILLDVDLDQARDRDRWPREAEEDEAGERNGSFNLGLSYKF